MKKLVIFDLDGTLLNTIADLAQSTNHALSVLGYPTHEESAYNFMVGNGINKLFERALPEGEKSEENVLRVRKEFIPYYDAHNADNSFLPAGQVKLFLDKAEHNREYHKHDGDHACRTVGGCGSSQLGNACVSDSVGVECARNHICECCNNDAAENPRENQEQLAAGFADVLLNQHTHRLALVLNRSVQRAEVGYRAEEYAADQHPQQYRQPAERRSLNCAGYRACARDGGELVTEYRPAVGRYKVLAVIKFNGRRLGFRVDTPFVRQPASVENVRAEQNNSRDQHDYKCVHVFSSLS